jgi:hypothetical protein
LTLSHDQVRSGAAGLFIFRTMDDRIIDEFQTTKGFEGFWITTAISNPAYQRTTSRSIMQ